MYEKQHKKLKKILISNAQIEHIGSTAVLGLGGKGIIDILIAVPKKELEKTKKALEENKFKFKPKSGDKARLYFKKFYIYKGEKQALHVHLTYTNSSTWKASIIVRDHLRKNKKDREKYAKIKKEAVKESKGEAEKYRNHKKEFLEKITSNFFQQNNQIYF